MLDFWKLAQKLNSMKLTEEQIQERSQHPRIRVDYLTLIKRSGSIWRKSTLRTRRKILNRASISVVSIE
jgi:hypothetical protein